MERSGSDAPEDPVTVRSFPAPVETPGPADARVKARMERLEGYEARIRAENDATLREIARLVKRLRREKTDSAVRGFVVGLISAFVISAIARRVLSGE